MPGIKKSKSITLGWTELIPEGLPPKPEGYSTAAEIADNRGTNRTAMSDVLRRLRESGKIECMQVRGKHGKTVWVYKD